MKPLFILIILAATFSASADENILLQRVIALEKRVAELETKLAPVLEEERVKIIVAEQKKRAHDRMMLDAEVFSRIDLNLIEKLYQTINKDRNSEEAAKSIKMLLERYPTANRTGCAVLYLGQMSKGDEQLNYLKLAIEKYNSSYYRNGVQVGAYARLYLGMRLYKEGKKEEAENWFNEIRANYPDAIDHKGKLLTSHINDLHR